MDLSPLTVVVLLAFGLLVAFCLTLWTTLGNFGRAKGQDTGGGSVTGLETDRPDQSRRTTMRQERPASERRQESRIQAEKPAARVRTEPTPVVMPPDSSRTRRPASESPARPEPARRSLSQDEPDAAGSESRGRASSDTADAGRVEPKQPSRSKRGKDVDDAFERFLKAKDEFDIR